MWQFEVPDQTRAKTDTKKMPELEGQQKDDPNTERCALTSKEVMQRHAPEGAPKRTQKMCPN